MHTQCLRAHGAASDAVDSQNHDRALAPWKQHKECPQITVPKDAPRKHSKIMMLEDPRKIRVPAAR